MLNNRTIMDKINDSLGEYSQSGEELNFQICPFCGDGKGHFYLNSRKLLFYCFKCNVGGGTYILARKLGLQLAEGPAERLSQEIKSLAFSFFCEQLAHSTQAEDARNWLHDRGIAKEWLSGIKTDEEKVPKRLPIGFHPGDDETMKYFAVMDYTKEQIWQSGILLDTLANFTGSLVFTYHLDPYRIGRFKVRKVRGSSKASRWLGQRDDLTGVFGLQLCSLPGAGSPGEVVCVEGEFDALALYILSAKNGGAT